MPRFDSDFRARRKIGRQRIKIVVAGTTQPDGSSRAERAIREMLPPYVCLRTDRRRIQAHAAAMLANRPSGGNHETQRNLQPEIIQASDRRAEAEHAAVRANAADPCDDRVSENLFDLEDERAEVDIIVHRMIDGAN